MQLSIIFDKTADQLEKWTAENIPRQDNRKVIITGANSGIGFEMARMLALRGAVLIMACRNLDKAAQAEAKIRRSYPEAELSVMHLDLSSLESVKSFAAEYKKIHTGLDILINNAGVMATPYRKTADGFEWQFGINHLGHFALTGQLMDLLIKTEGSRVVTVSSIAHFKGQLHFDDLEGETWYSPMKAYRQSKLANLLFAYELQNRLSKSGSGTLSVAAHPGLSSTNIVWLPFPLTMLKELVLMSATKGALPVLMGATDDSIRGGEYLGPAGKWQSYGYPSVLKSGKHSYEKAVWKRLWEVSEELTGVYYSFK